MSLRSHGIEHRSLPETRVATVRFNLRKRSDLHEVLDRVRRALPENSIAGPAFCIYRFVSSVSEGYDVDAGFPITGEMDTGEIEVHTLPSMDVLTLMHSGSPSQLGSTYGELFGTASRHGIISDEFCREVFVHDDNPEGDMVEVQLVIHDWNGLLEQSVDRVLGKEARLTIMRGAEDVTLDSSAKERCLWGIGMMARLCEKADDAQVYDILSSCAHVFPAEPIQRARSEYERVRAKDDDGLTAVDAAIAYMRTDPAWGEAPYREGNVIFTSKSPRDPKRYEEATTDAERRSASCFCPVIRDNLEMGMPVSYCYCGSGWYRRQWEEITGRSVFVQIIKSLLQGDAHCEFAVHLPEDL